MNLTKAQKARLGVFVLAGTGLFLTMAFSLIGLKAFEKRDNYIVRFSESISGLERSAQVKYQGLRVGRVDDMRIAKDEPGSIEVVLSLEHGTTLYEGTHAILDSSGLTGLKTINLTPGDPRKHKIKPGGTIPAGESFMGVLTGKAESIAIKVERVANQLSSWTNDENRQRFESLLESIDQLAGTLDRFLDETREPAVKALNETARAGAVFRIAAKQGTATLAELEQTLRVSRSAVAEARDILRAVDKDEVKGMIVSAHSAVARLDRRLSDAELGATVKQLRGTLDEVTTLLQEMDLAVRAGREDFVISLKHVRQATENLREFSRIISQDPSILLRGKEVGE